MKILFLSRWFPYPPDNGSKIRVFNLLKALSASHEVDLVSFTSEAVLADQLSAVHQHCRDVKTVLYRSFQPNGLRARLGFFSRRPRSAVDTWNSEMQTWATHMAGERSYDAVIASQLDMAPYALGLPVARRIYEEVELATFYEQFARAKSWKQKLRRGLMWWKMSAYVADLLPGFQGCTVVSEGERRLVQQVLPGYGPVAMVPNGVDVAASRQDFGEPEPDTLVYAGALTYHANLDAVTFFAQDILPIIQKERPQVKLYVTGKLDGVPLERLPRNPAVVFTGYLNDIRPRVARSWASVVPLRIGGGTRLKILEALALGTPVVTTRKGMEGLDLIPGDDVLVADTPTEFAAAVVNVLRARELRARLSARGRQTVTARYDWPDIGRHFTAFVESVVHASPTAAERVI